MRNPTTPPHLSYARGLGVRCPAVFVRARGSPWYRARVAYRRAILDGVIDDERDAEWYRATFYGIIHCERPRRVVCARVEALPRGGWAPSVAPRDPLLAGVGDSIALSNASPWVHPFAPAHEPLWSTEQADGSRPLLAASSSAVDIARAYFHCLMTAPRSLRTQPSSKYIRILFIRIAAVSRRCPVVVGYGIRI